MTQHNASDSIKDQIQAVLDFAASGIDETQYQIFEDTHNHDCYSREDREDFKQNQTNYTAGIAIIAALPDLLKALQHAAQSCHHPACGAKGKYVGQPERYCTCHVQKARAAVTKMKGELS